MICNICSNVANFPAKRLRKNTAPKIRMRQFFFFSKIVIFQSTLPIKWTFSLVVLYHHLLLVKGTVFLYIYSVNHKRFKFNRVFILLNYLQSQGKLLKWYWNFYFVYILRLLAGKSGPFCTEFPLATFSAKNLTRLPLK